MERSEPTFVPQWLKNSGSSSGGGSISHSDDRAASGIARNKSFVNNNGRSSSSERSTYFRRSSSSNAPKTYSNFGGRNRREKEWQKDTYEYHDKDKLVFGNGRHREFSEPPAKTFSGKFEMNGSRRTQSTVSGKHEDTWPRKIVTDLGSHSGNNINGVLSKSSPVGGVKKETIETDFPALGAEERKTVPEVGRIPSPSLVSSFQSLSNGTSTVIGGDKWTSALAEVPMLVGNNGTAISSVQQAAPSSPSSVVSGTTNSLNMAETVAQGPGRVQTAPQLSVGTQRLQELAIKQSRQLIPVTPSLPKALVTASSDKQRTKAGLLQHSVSSPLPVIHSPRAAPVIGEASKLSTGGKLQILKPVREKNGFTYVKDSSISANGSKVLSSATAPAPSVSGSTGSRGPLTVLEKRPTSQAKSRNDFFNLVRKKSLANSSPVANSVTENSPSMVVDAKVSPRFPDKLTEMEAELAPSTPQGADNPLSTNPSENLSERATMTCNGGAEKNGCNGKKHPSHDPIFSEEEEAAFLRSLGWEENADEDSLTEEEITAFYRDVVAKYINSKPSLKILLQGVQLKFQLPFESQMGAAIGGVSSGLSSSKAKLEP